MQVLCCLYNQHLSLWEPLIEPFDFELHGERDKTGYQVDIQSKNRLNINVTENLLFFQRDIATRLSKLLHESESTFVRAKFRPYTIENRTGLEMYFGTNASEKNWKVSNQAVTLTLILCVNTKKCESIKTKWTVSGSLVVVGIR